MQVISNDQVVSTHYTNEGNASGNTDNLQQHDSTTIVEVLSPSAIQGIVGGARDTEAAIDTAIGQIPLAQVEEVQQQGSAHVAVTAVAEEIPATTSTKAAAPKSPAARKPYDKSVEQPFHEHMVPGSKFFFSTAKEITPADYEKELRKKLDQVPLWLEATSYREFFGRLVMLFTMAKISMRRGLKHSLLFRDVLKEKVLEWAKKELGQSDEAKKFYSGDDEFDQFRIDLWNFNWDFENTDSRATYAMSQAIFEQLAQRAETGGERYEKALVYIANIHGFDIKRKE